MNTFTLNGTLVPAKRFDFNMLCNLEDLGVSISEADKKPMALVRAYVAICLGSNLDYAGQQMEQHLIGGGSFEDIMDVMSKEMESSDFFRNINQPKTVTKKASKTQKQTE